MLLRRHRKEDIEVNEIKEKVEEDKEVKKTTTKKK